MANFPNLSICLKREKCSSKKERREREKCERFQKLLLYTHRLHHINTHTDIHTFTHSFHMVMHTYSPQLSYFGSCIVDSTAAVGLLGKRTRRTKRVNIFFFFTLGRLDDLLPLMICRRIQQSFLCWHTHLWRKNKEKVDLKPRDFYSIRLHADILEEIYETLQLIIIFICTLRVRSVQQRGIISTKQ